GLSRDAPWAWTPEPGETPTAFVLMDCRRAARVPEAPLGVLPETWHRVDRYVTPGTQLVRDAMQTSGYRTLTTPGTSCLCYRGADAPYPWLDQESPLAKQWTLALLAAARAGLVVEANWEAMCTATHDAPWDPYFRDVVLPELRMSRGFGKVRVHGQKGL